MTTDRVMAFARERFIDSVENFLDDPHGVLATGSPDATPIAEYVAERRLLAADLGLNFDQLLDTHGTLNERERLYKLMDAAGCLMYAAGSS